MSKFVTVVSTAAQSSNITASLATRRASQACLERAGSTRDAHRPNHHANTGKQCLKCYRQAGNRRQFQRRARHQAALARGVLDIPRRPACWFPAVPPLPRSAPRSLFFLRNSTTSDYYYYYCRDSRRRSVYNHLVRIVNLKSSKNWFRINQGSFQVGSSSTGIIACLRRFVFFFCNFLPLQRAQTRVPRFCKTSVCVRERPALFGRHYYHARWPRRCPRR
jgi:hypothetical protein